MLDYLVDGLVIVAMIYGVVTICYWAYKFYQTWQKVKALIQSSTDNDLEIGEIYKESVTRSRQDSIAVTGQASNKEKVND